MRIYQAAQTVTGGCYEQKENFDIDTCLADGGAGRAHICFLSKERNGNYRVRLYDGLRRRSARGGSFLFDRGYVRVDDLVCERERGEHLFPGERRRIHRDGDLLQKGLQDRDVYGDLDHQQGGVGRKAMADHRQQLSRRRSDGETRGVRHRL